MSDIDEELGRLYRTARAHEAPTEADRVAVRAAVASALVVTTGAVSAHAGAGTLVAAHAAHAAKAITIGKLAGWLCMGAALGGLTSSAAWVLTSPSEPPGVAPVSTPINVSRALAP